jgi:hypothetical protein
MVQAVELFLTKNGGPKTNFIIRPQWSYNYSITGDFVDGYKHFIGALKPWLTLDEWKAKVGDVADEQIHCISFPRVNRMNILHNVNWGHELGHIVAGRWIDANFSGIWLSSEATIKGKIEVEIKKKFQSATGLFADQILNAEVAAYLKTSMELARKGMTELLCDAIGAHLLGPAIFASLSEYASRLNLDATPLEGAGYPPWRYRLRKVGERLQESLTKSLEIVKVEQGYSKLKPLLVWLEETQKLSRAMTGAPAREPDVSVIQMDVRSRAAYELIESNWSKVSSEVMMTLPQREPYQFELRLAFLAELVEKLYNGIPPNETGVWPDTKSAELADIWNAAWAFKLNSEASPADWDDKNDINCLNRLVLKAIEAAFVHDTYGKKLTEQGDK